MPSPEKLVINTGPLIALVGALDSLRILDSLYERVIAPFEVCREIRAGGSHGFAMKEFEEASWLEKRDAPVFIPPILANSLDLGEAAVIQLALNLQIQTVCIDEPRGRRFARLSGLSVTGSIGILLRAKREGFPLDVRQAVLRMEGKGIWLSERVRAFAFQYADDKG
jgi:predicted nucleic acid-binding protein